MDSLDDLGERIVAILGEGAASDLLSALERPEADRAALIGRLALRDDARWLAELLAKVETDPDDITRLRIVGALESWMLK